jgi:hypothetical protein
MPASASTTARRLIATTAPQASRYGQEQSPGSHARTARTKRAPRIDEGLGESCFETAARLRADFALQIDHDASEFKSLSVRLLRRSLPPGPGRPHRTIVTEALRLEAAGTTQGNLPPLGEGHPRRKARAYGAGRLVKLTPSRQRDHLAHCRFPAGLRHDSRFPQHQAQGCQHRIVRPPEVQLANPLSGKDEGRAEFGV